MKSKPSYIQNYEKKQEEDLQRKTKLLQNNLNKPDQNQVKNNKKNIDLDDNQSQSQNDNYNDENQSNSEIQEHKKPKISHKKQQLTDQRNTKSGAKSVISSQTNKSNVLLNEKSFQKYLKKIETIIEKSKGKTVEEKIMKLDIKNEKVDIKNKHLLRRWDAKIREVKVQSLQKEDLNIFLVFKLGASERINSQLEAEIVDNTKSVKQFKTEILKQIKKGETRVVDAYLDTEIHASYDMLQNRYLIIEIWEYSSWKLNKYLGKTLVPLSQVAQSDLRSSVVIKKAFADKKGFARVYYMAYFQEIWDFYITLYNWKAYNTVNKYNQPMETYLKFTLKDKENFDVTIKSESSKIQDANPAFNHIPGSIYYRGTMDDLEDKLMEIQIVEKTTFNISDQNERKVIVSLRGISDFDCIKGLIKLKQEDKKKKDKNDDGQYSDDSNEIQTGKKMEADLKYDTAVYSTVEGRINLNKKPCFLQKGEFVRFCVKEYYLIIVINRCENILAPDDRGVVNSYLTVQCGGTTKRTSTKYDNTKPDFNEDLVYKIPIIKPNSIFGMNEIQYQEIVNDQIRDWLKRNNIIYFHLWLDGEDVMSDDNLGFTTCNLYEIQNAPLEPKSFSNYQTKKSQNFVTRVLSQNNKFTSSRSDSGNISITFQVYFTPDIDKSIDLKDFMGTMQDQYPQQIQDKMKYQGEDYQQCKYYVQYQKKIQKTFQQHPLERNAFTIFYKSVFIKDQYNIYHFACKFIEKFSLPTRERKSGETDDLSIVTFKECAHYVRCIPYNNSKFEIWNSPEFMLTLKTGNAIDKSLLMAGLFMTVDEIQCKKRNERYQLSSEKSIKPQQDQKKGFGIKLLDIGKNDIDPYSTHIPIEDRVFICIGTLKNGEITSWVMVIEDNLIDITFWDVREHKEYLLKGRIVEQKLSQTDKITEKNRLQSVRYKMRKLLRPLTSDLQDDDIFEEDIKEEEEEEVIESEEEENSDQDEQEQENLRQLEILRQDKTDQQQEQVQQKVIDLNTFKSKNSKKKIPNIKKLMQKQANDTKSILSKKGGSVKDKSQVSQDQLKVSYIKPNLSLLKSNKSKNQVGGFLKSHQEQVIEQENTTDAAKFSALAIFKNDKNQEVTQDEADMKNLPYNSIEVVFNSRNLYANIQNQRPQDILYHLYDEDKWYPFIQNEVNHKHMHNGKQVSKIIKRWQGKIDTFWEGRNPNPELSIEKCQTKEKDIIDEIKLGIENARSAINQLTNWQSDNEPTQKKLIELLRIYEYRDLGRNWVYYEEDDPILKTMKEVVVDHQKAINRWEQQMKKLIPQGYQFIAMPMSFTYADYMRIKAIVLENLEPLYTRKGKKLVYGVGCKIFNYPNKINSVRVVLACYFNKQETLEDQEEEEEEDINDNKNLNNLEQVKEENDEDEEEDEQNGEDQENAPLKN